MRKMSRFQSVDILGVRVDDLSKDEMIDFILKAAVERRRVVIAYANVHTVNLASAEAWFRDFLNASDVVFCDGFGVRLAAWLLHHRRIERFTPPDWLPELAAVCGGKGLSIFLLGGRPEVAGKAAAKLVESAPGFRAAGAWHGYFDRELDGRENREVVARINQAAADILLVGFGMPLQEKWIEENRAGLDASVIMTVGAAFDYLAGEVRRAPRWATTRGLEWLGRLLVEPRRLWRRYLIGNPLFFWRVFLHTFGLQRESDG